MIYSLKEAVIYIFCFNNSIRLKLPAIQAYSIIKGWGEQ